MKIPSNLVTVDYTTGNEFFYLGSQEEYQGYYCQIAGNYHAGKEPSINNPLLIKKDSLSYNNLLDNPKLKTYSIISGNTSQKLSSPNFNSLPQSNKTATVDTYYSKKINVIPVSIKQIDKNTYDSLQQNPFYQTTFLKADQSNINQAEKQMPGLKEFLGII